MSTLTPVIFEASKNIPRISHASNLSKNIIPLSNFDLTLWLGNNITENVGTDRTRIFTETGTTWSNSDTPIGFGWDSNNDPDTHLSTGAWGSQPPLIWTYELVLWHSDTANQVYWTFAEAPDSSVSDRGIQYNSSGGNFEAYVFDGSPQTLDSQAIITDTPYHIIVSCDGSTMFISVNGINNSQSVSNGGYTGYTTPELLFGNGSLSGSGLAVGIGDQVMFARFAPIAINHAQADIRTSTMFGGIFRSQGLALHEINNKRAVFING